MKICFVFDDLLGGGAARVVTLLGNAFAKKGWSVILMTMDDGKLPRVFYVEEGIQHMPLSLRVSSRSFASGMYMNLHRIAVLSQTLRRVQPDYVISFLDRTNILVLLATRFSGIPVIISERTDPAGRHIGRPWELLRRVTYPWASSLVCQGERPFRYFSKRIRRRGAVIPNPVMVPVDFKISGSGNAAHRPESQRMIVALGSLRQEKGFDLLLEAFARIAKEHTQWSLTIWGEGPCRSSLQTQAQTLGIEQRVFLPGFTLEPFTRLSEADLFVLSSRVEGFPNALCEAMAVGLPVIATDVGAVRDIIRQGIDGIAVRAGDVSALAEAMNRLMSDMEGRLRLASRAPEVLKRFSLEKVVGIWEDLLLKVAGNKLSFLS